MNGAGTAVLLAAVLTLAAAGVLAALLLLRRQGRLASERLFEEQDNEGEEPDADDPQPPRLRALVGRYRWVAVVGGVAAWAAVEAFASLAAVIGISVGIIVGLLVWQLEQLWYANRLAKLEGQLANAIDLMVGALGAGAGAMAALDAAARETPRPLKPVLEDLLARVRLGDSPQAVFGELAERVPLETFLLFSSTLSVHWEVGGSLAPILATVGRTIRDRIEISRRIRTNSTQARVSTISILGLTYFLAFLMWRTSPEQMEDFVTSETAAYFVAGSMLLQAVGIAWMSQMVKAKF